MSDILRDPSLPQLIQTIESNFFQFWTYLDHSSQVELYDGPDMIRFLSDVPSPICNSIFRAKLSTNNVSAEIKDAVTHFQSRRLPVRWMVSPSSQPDNLCDHLQAFGFTHSGYATAMAVNLSELNTSINK